jgi:radical SAM superfamily enzyme YgiQ (UPF0313 family)
MLVFLANPSWGGRVQGGRYNRRWPALDLLNVAALLRVNGFEVSLYDGRADDRPARDFSQALGSADYRVVTTSPLDRWQCPNIDLGPLLEWIAAVPREKLIICGAHGTAFPEEILKLTGARFVVRGEPEEAVSALLNALRDGAPAFEHIPSLSYRNARGIHHTAAGPPADLASLPLPAYDLIRPEHYDYEPLGSPLAVLETARGCPHRCAYCFKAMYGPAFRLKPLQRVKAEIDQVARLGYRFVYFMDLEFSLNRRRTIELCRLIGASGIRWCCQTRVDAVDPELLEAMAAAGCKLVHYGIESGDVAVLEAIHKTIGPAQAENAVKWTKAAGMASAGFFLLGLPGETQQSWSKTEALARKINLTYASFHSVTVYPHTEMATCMGKNTPWWESEEAPSPPRDRLRRVYLRYYLRPRYWKEYLLRGSRRLSPFRLFLQFLGGLGAASRKHRR